MKEFREAHAHATGNGRNKFLIPILYGDLQVGDLSTEMRFYLENHTYIEYKKVGIFASYSESYKHKNDIYPPKVRQRLM